MLFSEELGPFYTQFDAPVAFKFYEHVRDRLPPAEFCSQSEFVGGLLEVADRLDVFVFDAFGVLNVGAAPIPGAAEVISSLRDMGKKIFVVTNAATFPKPKTVQKFRNLGFDFCESEIVTSRMAAEEALASKPNINLWGVLSKNDFIERDIEAECVLLGANETDFDRVDGFLFLSTWDWNDKLQLRLEKSLSKKPRPLVVANPDVIAPQESGFSTESGYCGHRIAEMLDLKVEFHGKPFPSVFDIVERTLPNDLNRKRICMIGDTLHTDVLGGAGMGWSTVLVTDHGLFRGEDISKYIDDCGIVPTFVVPSI